MARPKKGTTLESRARSSLTVVDGGHWISNLHWHKNETFVLRSGDKYFSQLLVLWSVAFGDPVGQLSNACGRSECVNPYHYRDQSDREQSGWRAEECNGKELLDKVVEGEGNRFMQIADIILKSDILINNVYGMTNDMGCYHCGKRFDPLAGRNKVICPDCWTDEDQSFMEGDNAD